MFDRLDQGPYQATATERLLQHGERCCPMCGGAMRVVLGRDALADVCPGHGVWFDQDEWERFTSARPAAEARAGLAGRPVVRRRYRYTDERDVESLFDLGGGD